MSTQNTSKEILAKLMATENILIEHANVPTAAFDLKSRKLILPMWKDISDDVYTLLISHEVGHALYTPLDQFDEMIKTENSSLKVLVNIVEDVRIEKLIQSKFPGTVKSFKIGYNELEQKNIFGTKGRTIDQYEFVDRINLYFKIGHFNYGKIPFSENEFPWISKISACSTFSDVLRVSKELLQFIKEQHEQEQHAEQEQQQEQDQEQEPESDVPPLSENAKISVRNFDQSCFHEKSNPENQKSEERVISETQQNFDSSMLNHIDTKSESPKYVYFPKLDLSELIVDYRNVHSSIKEFYSRPTASTNYAQIDEKVERYKTWNKSIVNQLAMLFEMKKRAKLNSKILVSRTGKLDTNKIFSYRYSEDVFKKIATIPEGKSHGLVMFLDMSSSMNDNMYGTYEQVLNLVLFCRRVNLPFVVYGFTDIFPAFKPRQFDKDEIMFNDDFHLREYFSNKMSQHEFNLAFKNMLMIMEYYAPDSSSHPYLGLPKYEGLNQTPLIPAIISAMSIIPKFRKSYNLDIVNTIFLTDGGDTHGLYSKIDSDRILAHYGELRIKNRTISSSSKSYVRDRVTKKTWQIQNPTETMLEILRDVTGTRIIGYHLCNLASAKIKIAQFFHKGIATGTIDDFKSDGFLDINNANGYDAYYLISSGKHLRLDSSEFDPKVDFIESDEQNSNAHNRKQMKSVVKNFNSFMTKRISNRILLNKFIEKIS